MVLYLTIIFISMALIGICNIIFNPQAFELYEVWLMLAISISVVFEFAIDGLFAALCRLLPKKCFLPENKFFQVSKKERVFYEKLGIKSWKDKVWELGAMGGFRKNKIKNPNSPEYLNKFLIESNMGIVMHMIGVFVGFAVMFIFPLKYALCIGLPVALVNAVLNTLPTMILRYNIPKLSVAYKRAVRLQERENETPVQTSEELTLAENVK